MIKIKPLILFNGSISSYFEFFKGFSWLLYIPLNWLHLFSLDQNKIGDGDLISNIFSQTFPFQRSILLSAITISTLLCNSSVKHSVIIAANNFLHVFHTALANFDILVVGEDYIVQAFFQSILLIISKSILRCSFPNSAKWYIKPILPSRFILYCKSVCSRNLLIQTLKLTQGFVDGGWFDLAFMYLMF